ncbi:S26 family signal peptidase [Azotobacter chroococcum]
MIEADRYWFFGRTADSFDSRYWGSVASHQIIGRAYPLW